jgi:hypothetical protein
MAELDIDSQRVAATAMQAESQATSFPAGETERRDRPGLRWIRAVLPVGLGALAVLFFFAFAGGIRHIRVPVGADSYFYVQALRITERYGLGMRHLLARPAYPLIGAALAETLRVSPWTATVALTLAMTGCLGVAGGAILARWRLTGPALALGVFLVGASVTGSRLLAGKSENLMNVWLLTAVLAVALWGGSRRATIAVAVLAFGAGLAEWPFLAAFLLILFVALVLWEVAPWSPRERERRSVRAADGNGAGGGRWVLSSSGHLNLGPLFLATLTAGFLVALVVGVWNGTGPSDAVELAPLPAQQYLIGLKTQLRFEWPLLTSALFMVGWWAARRFQNRDVEPVRWLLTVWAAIVGLTILVGLTGVPLPAYRALTFDLPIALGVATATFLPAASARSARGLRRLALGAMALVLAVLAVVPAFATWYRDINPPTTPAQLGEIQAASSYSLGLGGRPVILVVQRWNPVITYFLQRAVVAAAGGGGQRVIVVVGRAGDVMAGRPTMWGWGPYDTLSRSLFKPVLQAYLAGAPVLVGETLDPPGFASAVSRHRPMVGPALAVLRGPPPRPKTHAPPVYRPLPLWWEQAALAALFILILSLCGAGWSRLALQDAPPAVRAALAPAFGAVALAVTTLITARAFGHLDGVGSAAAVSVALLGSMAAAVAGLRADRARAAVADA